MPTTGYGPNWENANPPWGYPNMNQNQQAPAFGAMRNPGYSNQNGFNRGFGNRNNYGNVTGFGNQPRYPNNGGFFNQNRNTGSFFNRNSNSGSFYNRNNNSGGFNNQASNNGGYENSNNYMGKSQEERFCEYCQQHRHTIDYCFKRLRDEREKSQQNGNFNQGNPMRGPPGGNISQGTRPSATPAVNHLRSPATSQSKNGSGRPTQR
jgi:hypothetical protein